MSIKAELKELEQARKVEVGKLRNPQTPPELEDQIASRIRKIDEERNFLAELLEY
ncbi:hypothetical protein [Actinopolyspora erythraea]|uniref:hypothetical protein n=1 Tax=Actinopolyspora erythraea TaxID=414996 RepID=UPI0012B61E1E|nr:hypothetical protein [Actinopolyspora erythraea]